MLQWRYIVVGRNNMDNCTAKSEKRADDAFATALYEWDFSSELEWFVKYKTLDVAGFYENLQRNIKYEKDCPRYLEDIGEFFFLGCLLAEKKPEKARSFFYKEWSKEANANTLFVKKILESKSSVSPAAHRLMLEVLQYGPNKNWSAEVAYSPELDGMIESLLLKLGSLNVSDVEPYSQKYPSVAMFKVIEALVRIKNKELESATPTNLLEQAYQMGIPAKYRYFIVNFVEGQIRKIALYLKGLDKYIPEKIRCFMIVFNYNLFPTAARQQECITHLPEKKGVRIVQGEDILGQMAAEIRQDCQDVAESRARKKRKKEEDAERAQMGCIIVCVVLFIIGIAVLALIKSIFQ